MIHVADAGANYPVGQLVYGVYWLSKCHDPVMVVLEPVL